MLGQANPTHLDHDPIPLPCACLSLTHPTPHLPNLPHHHHTTTTPQTHTHAHTEFKNQNEVNFLPLELSADEVTLAVREGEGRQVGVCGDVYVCVGCKYQPKLNQAKPN